LALAPVSDAELIAVIEVIACGRTCQGREGLKEAVIKKLELSYMESIVRLTLGCPESAFQAMSMQGSLGKMPGA